MVAPNGTGDVHISSNAQSVQIAISETSNLTKARYLMMSLIHLAWRERNWNMFEGAKLDVEQVFWKIQVHVYWALNIYFDLHLRQTWGENRKDFLISLDRKVLGYARMLGHAGRLGGVRISKRYASCHPFGFRKQLVICCGRLTHKTSLGIHWLGARSL